MNHTILVKQCLEWLAMNSVVAWPNNTGSANVDGRFMSFGYKGSGDIIGVVPISKSSEGGKFFAIEVKTGTGRQRKEQRAYQYTVERSGAYYFLIRSIIDLESVFSPLFDKSDACSLSLLQ